MIVATHLEKCFGEVEALKDVSITIREGEVFGLIGTNGAGKSTFLRLACGVLKPDSGNIVVDEQAIYENEEMKQNIFYLSDDQYYLPNATPMTMLRFYKDYYPLFDGKRFLDMLEKLGLDANRKINTFSKGMKKQLSVLLGICANTKYLFCDETFDGLDPVMRQTVKSIFAGELTNRSFTPIVASHNLRELEDICDHIGLLHKGGVLMQKDLEQMKLNIHTIQCVFEREELEQAAMNGLEVIKVEKRGRLKLLTVRGKKEEVMAHIQKFSPVFVEILPLSLEEIFISETEVAGYDIKKIIF